MGLLRSSTLSSPTRHWSTLVWVSKCFEISSSLFTKLRNQIQGRYGDSVNPWGDIMAVAEAWCVTTPEARLAIGVPVTSGQHGVLVFNAHRIYGAKNYPYLVR